MPQAFTQQSSEAVQRNKQLQELLAACSVRDREAFAVLYERTSAKLFGVVLRILNRDEWAQDCLQEAYIKIWNNAGSFRPDRAAAMTWMTTIARNQALDHIRRRKREVSETLLEGIPEEPDKALPQLEKLSQNEDGRRLKRCLDELKSEQRQVIALAYYKGLTHDQLATQMNTPLGTIKTWIRRGLEQLKRCLSHD